MRRVALAPWVAVILFLTPTAAGAAGLTCPEPRGDQEWNKSEGRRYFSLGNTMFKAKRYEEAVAAFECVLRLVPYSMNTRHRLAESYEMAGDLVTAREQYELALADDSPETEALRPAMKAKVSELERRIARGESRPLGSGDDGGFRDAPPPTGHAVGPTHRPPRTPIQARPGLLEDFPDLRHRVELNLGLASSASAAPTSTLGYFFRQTARVSWGANFGGMGFGLTSASGTALTGKGYFVLPGVEWMYLQYGGLVHVAVGAGLGYVFAQLENTTNQKSNAHSGFGSLYLAMDYRFTAAFSLRFALRYHFFLGMTGPNDETVDRSTTGVYEFGIQYRF